MIPARPPIRAGNGKIRIAILDDHAGVARQLVDWSGIEAAAELSFFRQALRVPDEAAAVLADFDVICCLRERTALPARLLDRLPRLKLIVVTGPRHRELDYDAATRLGIAVRNVEHHGPSRAATMELAWGLILSLARHLPDQIAGMRAGAWQTRIGTSLAGRTLGLVGLGRLGQRMVPVAHAFGMEVLAWSPNLTAETARAAGARRVEKDTLFAGSDIVSLHLVLGERSRGIVDAAALALMKPTAWLVNTARGPLVDLDALVAALREGRIAGAALDVFDTEPLPADDELRRLPSLLTTPHLGYAVEETLRAFYRGTAAILTDFLQGRVGDLQNPAVLAHLRAGHLDA